MRGRDARTAEAAHMDLDLYTDDLLLRPAELADAGWIARYAGDFDVARMTARIPHPYSCQMALDFLTAAVDPDYRKANRVKAIVRLRPEREPVGLISLDGIRDGSAELGYWLGKPFWGRGYATQAAVAMVEFAFKWLGLRQLTAGHYIDNPASGGVLQKAAFRYTGATEWLASTARCTREKCLRMIQLQNDWVKTKA